ncbi:alpha/beta fold hydrolase [Sporichthya polymorpha]|uniref:alpha/beta fold hydrolase n=1 Tax=Sporichthya polymorpha TaxID=35751 RepID=UPI003CCC4610
MCGVSTFRPGPVRLAAVTLTAALSVSAVHTSATAGPAADPRPTYGSEEVPTGETPGTPESGFAGDSTKAPMIVMQAEDFGQVAARTGVGLKTYVVSEGFGNARTLDVYTPRKFRNKTGRQVRTVILVHGGAWQKGDRTDLEEHAVELAQLGFVVVSVNYRLATEAPWSAQRNDVNAAIKFVRQNAKKLNVDNKRTVLLGSSAGGQIAAAVATSGAGRKRFRGLVTLSGLVNPLYMARNNPGYSNAVIPTMLLRCLPITCLDKYKSATAIHHLDKKDPPTLMFHSEREVWWGPEQAQQFVKKAKRVGVPARLVVLPGRTHGIDAWWKIFPTLKKWLFERLGTQDR